MNKKFEKLLYLLIFFLIIASFFLFLRWKNTGKENLDLGSEISENSEDLEIYVLDVGQGDSIFLRLPNMETILIDGSTKGQGANIVKKLENLHISRIDHIIGTHPHADHIGGLPQVIRSFDIGRVYLPNRVATTKIFEELLMEISNRNIELIQGERGLVVSSYSGGEAKILGPSREFKGTNDNSIVLKVSRGEFAALFTGDLELEGEKDLLGQNLKSDILKVGHHGSNTSSSEDFLKKVGPSYGVISLGEDNKYDHPDKEVLDRFKKLGTKIYRTDLDGDIYFKIGEDISIFTDLEL